MKAENLSRDVSQRGSTETVTADRSHCRYLQRTQSGYSWMAELFQHYRNEDMDCSHRSMA